ncbi:MAG TPA: thioesterase family protein [Actinomycetota bacterium]|nr:thioesterase family protein [Actinomycetota bacterium]
MTRFDRDTALERVGPDEFTGRVDRGWWVVNAPNGGYLASIMLRALTMTVDDPERSPRSLTVHYMRPAVEGPLTIHTTVERAGRSLSTVSARLYQGDTYVAKALAAFSHRFPAIEFSDAQMPDVPGSDVAPEPPNLEGRMPPIFDRMDYRFAYGDLPFSGSDRSVIGAWMRLKNGRAPDPLLVPTLADGCPPSIFGRLSEPIPAPTIDLTVHFRNPLALEDADPDDFLFAVFRSRVGAEGFFEEDGEIYSKTGILLAQSRQLALLR